MTLDGFPDALPIRQPWLMTLADLALLLLGSLLLFQALRHDDPARVAAGVRAAFGGPEALPVAAAALDDFAPGSAALPGATAAVELWAADALRDPRTSLTVTGEADGTAADTDPATGSAAILAAARAQALAAHLIASGVAPARIAIATRIGAPGRGRRAATATLAFAGTPPTSLR